MFRIAFLHDSERDKRAYNRKVSDEAQVRVGWVMQIMTLAFPAKEAGSMTGRTRLRCATNLLLLPEGKKTDSRYLHDFKSHTWNVTLGLSTTAETRNQDFVVLVDEVQTTIVLNRC